MNPNHPPFFALLSTKHSANFYLLVTLTASLLLLALSQIGDLNQTWFYLINRFTNDYFPSTVLAHITNFGNGSVSVTLAIIIIFALKRPQLFKQLLFTILITAIVSNLLKSLWDAPRPALILDRTSFDIIGDTLTSFSFPSGHTMTVFAATSFLVLICKNRSIQILLIIIAISSGLSRIAVGAHWPEDVFAGAAFGLLCAYSAFLMAQKPFSLRASYITGAILCVISALNILYGHHEFEDITSITIIRYTIVAINCYLGCYFISRRAVYAKKAV